jgi:hypothetical protein
LGLGLVGVGAMRRKSQANLLAPNPRQPEGRL